MEVLGNQCPRYRDLNNFLAASDRLYDMYTPECPHQPVGYTPRLCRGTQPGCGGAPVSTVRAGPADPPAPAPRRPASAPMGGGRRAARMTKTERWREGGQLRWPHVQNGDQDAQLEDVVPFRRTIPNPQQFWGNTLWTQSLRARGVDLEDPMFSNMGGNIKTMREEWQQPQGQQHMFMDPTQPYNGSTASGKIALNDGHDMTRWVERPVAVGKYAVEHLSGQRYQWDDKPRQCLTRGVEREVDRCDAVAAAVAYASAEAAATLSPEAAEQMALYTARRSSVRGGGGGGIQLVGGAVRRRPQSAYR